MKNYNNRGFVKKNSKIFILGILLFFMTFICTADVFAFTASTNLSCNKSIITPGEEFTCTLTGNVQDGVVSALSGKIAVSNNLTITSVEVDDIWEGDNEANLDLYTADNKSGSFAIATIKVKPSIGMSAGSKGTISFSGTKFYDGNYEGHSIEDKKLEVKAISNVDTLSNITLSTGTLVPNFSSDVLKYSATVNVSELTISATATDSSATISGDVGKVTLKYGINTFKINVTSEAGNVKIYTIEITRSDGRSNDNSLKSLKIDGNEIELEDDVFNYSYEVEKGTEEVKIDAEVNNQKATFVENYGSRTVTLEDGKAKIEIKVKAENGEVKTYTISVITEGDVLDEDEELDDDNSGSESTDKLDKNDSVGTKEEVDNPKTGSSIIFIIVAILVISVAGIVYYFKFYQKNKDGEKNGKTDKK